MDLISGLDINHKSIGWSDLGKEQAIDIYDQTKYKLVASSLLKERFIYCLMNLVCLEVLLWLLHESIFALSQMKVWFSRQRSIAAGGVEVS